MAINKKMRQQVYDKYQGHCAYCGQLIDIKDMQVDHLVPQRAYDYLIGEKAYRKRYKDLKSVDVSDLPDVDSFDNLMPACRRCNHYKRANMLETFRKYLLDMKHKLIDDSYLGKVAVDYGMLTWNGWDGRFYFEKLQKKEQKKESEWIKAEGKVRVFTPDKVLVLDCQGIRLEKDDV